MAHKGNGWPVLFRRDWNLNIDTNRIGWANRYLVTFPLSTTGFGTLVARIIHDCGPGGELPFGTMTWTAAIYRTAIFGFTVSVHSAFTIGGNDFVRTIIVREQNAGTIYIGQLGLIGPNPNTFFGGGQGSTVLYDKAFYDSDPVYWSAKIVPKTWKDGAPH